MHNPARINVLIHGAGVVPTVTLVLILIVKKMVSVLALLPEQQAEERGEHCERDANAQPGANGLFVLCVYRRWRA